jgi:hypothetical protein
MHTEAAIIDPVLRAAASEAIAASAANARADAQEEAEIEKQHNKAHLLTLAQRVSLPQIIVTLSAASIREKGLNLIRLGDLEGGAKLLTNARNTYCDQPMDLEAYQSADSFQLAAEAYLRYKRADYRHAEALLFRSLEACEVLHTHFQHKVTVRQVHLLANIVRLRQRDDRCEEALELATGILGWLYDDGAVALPASNITHSDAGSLRLAERLGLADQTLDSFSFATNAPNATLTVSCPDPRQLYDRLSETSGLPDVINDWLCAKRSAIANQVERSIVSAIGFLLHSRHLPRLTRAMRVQLQQDLRAI